MNPKTTGIVTACISVVRFREEMLVVKVAC